MGFCRFGWIGNSIFGIFHQVDIISGEAAFGIFASVWLLCGEYFFLSFYGEYMYDNRIDASHRYPFAIFQLWRFVVMGIFDNALYIFEVGHRARIAHSIEL